MEVHLLRWYNQHRVHILVWILYILYESVIVGIVFGAYGHPISYIFHFALTILYFYLHSDFLLPWAVAKKKWSFWRVPLIVIVLIIFYVVGHYLVNLLLGWLNLLIGERINFGHDFVLRNFYRSIYFMGFSTGYYFLKNYLNERRKTESLEKDKLHTIIKQQNIEQELSNAQNAYLKAQISPHFLFNTLDFIYHNVNKHSEVAGDAIISLSEMMRFAIDSGHIDGKISLFDEIQQVNNLIFLNQIRKSNQLHFHFTYPKTDFEIRIIPLLLLTLAENIFKHGVLTDPESPAAISISIDQEKLTIITNNLMSKKELVGSNGSGIKNIQRRMMDSYGNLSNFEYSVSKDQFLTVLTIPTEFLR